MLSINESSNASLLLRLGDSMNGQRCLSGRLRPINLNNPAFRVSSHAQCNVKTQRPCRYNLNVFYLFVAHTHDGTLAEILFYLRHCCLQCLHFSLLRSLFLLGFSCCQLFFCLCHDNKLRLISVK